MLFILEIIPDGVFLVFVPRVVQHPHLYPSFFVIFLAFILNPSISLVISCVQWNGMGLPSWMLVGGSPDQTVSGKGSSNPLMADNLPKIVWYSTHHVTLNEELSSPKANGSWANDNCDSPLLGVNTPRCDEDRLGLIELTVFLLPNVEKVGIRVNTVDLQVSAVRHMLLLSIKYALTVNPNIYVSCIKQFWTTVAVKQVNDVTRLQTLVDKQKVVVTEATIREALCLDDEEGVDCLPNEEFFAKLARMGYKKPSTKLTFYKAFFSSQKQVGDLSTHTTKYTSPALTQKVFANMRRVGKGFSEVETPLFESMLVEQQVAKEGDVDENDETVNAGDAAEGDVSAAHGEVLTVDEEPSIPSPTPPTPPPQPPQDIPLTSQERMIAEMDQDDAVVLGDDKEEDREVADAVKDVKEAKVDESSQNQGRQAESQAEIYKIDMDHANKVLSMQENKTEPAEVQEVVDVDTTAKLITEVVTATSETVTPAIIMDLEEKSTTSTIIPTETKSKDKGKAIDHVKRKAKEDLAVKRYQLLKRKPHTEVQARKNMMMYLKNVVGFKMDYYKGMSYDDIRPIFEAKFNSNVAFLLKTKEQIEEDENRALKRLNETPAGEQLNDKSWIRREDLEALWSLVKERFSTTKPKNFSDDFLLVTLRAMFEKPDIHAQI
nr:hypothetical protein [Tanacetum cinerariifolium]